MNKSQWNVLTITFWILMFLFIILDRNNGFIPVDPMGNPCDWTERMLFEKYDKGEITLGEYGKGIIDIEKEPLDKYDILCVLGGEMYEPFIYLSFILAIAFSICSFLEGRKN